MSALLCTLNRSPFTRLEQPPWRTTGFFDYVARPLFKAIGVLLRDAVTPHLEQLELNREAWEEEAAALSADSPGAASTKNSPRLETAGAVVPSTPMPDSKV